MQEAKCRKKKTKQSAQIYIGGIINSHEAFIDVTPKQFYSGLAHLGLPVEKDSRLKSIKGLESYYVPHECLEDIRPYGIWTTLIGYIHYKQHSLHYTIYQIIEPILKEIENYDLETIKQNMDIKELIPIKVKRYNAKKN